MSHDELVEALGTIAALRHQGLHGAAHDARPTRPAKARQLIGQFGVGFYSAFMVADRVDVLSRRAGADEAWRCGRPTARAPTRIAPVDRSRGAGARHAGDAAPDGGRQGSYTERYKHRAHRARAIRAMCRCRSSIIETARRRSRRESPTARRCGPSPALEIKPEEYADFYRSVAGQFDEPALTVHFRAEGRHEYTRAGFRAGREAVRPVRSRTATARMKLYVRRVFITDEAEIAAPLSAFRARPRWTRRTCRSTSRAR